MNVYEAFNVKQRPNGEVEFLVFVANAKEVNRWARADNIILDRGQVQRSLVDTRWRAVAKFYKANPNNVIPTSVTIAFDESLRQVRFEELNENEPAYAVDHMENERVRIAFPDVVTKEHAFIIDGQHRLRGMRDLDFDPVIPICLFLQLPIIERAFQFVVINNKSHKVPTDNLKALVVNFEADVEQPLRLRLARASVSVPRYASTVDLVNEDPESPFFKMIDWVNNRHEDAQKLVAPTAIENSVRAVSRALNDIADDDSEALAVFNLMWTAIFEVAGVTLENASMFKRLLMKATIQTLTEMVVRHVTNTEDVAFQTDNASQQFESASIAQSARDLVSRIPAEFWQDEWALKSLDTQAGRAIIEKDVRAVKKLAVRGEIEGTDWRASLSVYRNPKDATAE